MSRRRKQSSSRARSAHKHSASCSCGPVAQCPDCWPDASLIAEHVDLDELTRRALDAMTNDDVYEVMQQIPHKFRQLMLREIGLTSASSVNRGMAGMVLARIRGEQHPAGSQLLNMLTQPLTTLLDTPLDVQEWNALLGDDARAAVKVLADQEQVNSLMSTAVRQMPPPLVIVGLASAVAYNAAAAAVALSLLAMSDPACERAHAELTAQYPQMPPIPSGQLSDLLAYARLRAALPEDVVGQIDDADDAGALHALLEEYLVDIVEPAGAGPDSDDPGSDDLDDG